MWTATILPSLELLCGLSLIIGLYPRVCELLMTLLLVGIYDAHRLRSVTRTRYFVRMFFSKSGCR